MVLSDRGSKRASVCVWVCEREIQRERKGETETETVGHRETDRYTGTQIDR